MHLIRERIKGGLQWCLRGKGALIANYFTTRALYLLEFGEMSHCNVHVYLSMQEGLGEKFFYYSKAYLS